MATMQQLDEQISAALARKHVARAADLYCKRAALHARKNALAQARADCTSAIKLDGACAKAYFGRAKLMDRTGASLGAVIDELQIAQRCDTVGHGQGNVTIGGIGKKAARYEEELRAANKTVYEAEAEAAADAAARKARAAADAAARKARAAADAAAQQARAQERYESFKKKQEDFFRQAFGQRPFFQDHRRSSSTGPRVRAGSHYSVLGVDATADDTTIRKAYKKLCLKYHPDKAGANAMTPEKEEAKKKFLEVQRAYDTLSDPSKRKLYDMSSSFTSRMDPPVPPECNTM